MGKMERENAGNIQSGETRRLSGYRSEYVKTDSITSESIVVPQKSPKVIYLDI
jgi:hypothetical protein